MIITVQLMIIIRPKIIFNAANESTIHFTGWRQFKAVTCSPPPPQGSFDKIKLLYNLKTIHPITFLLGQSIESCASPLIKWDYHCRPSSKRTI
jgi:hypothetical protein